MKQRVFSPFRSELEAVVARFGLSTESLEIVDSIRDYCVQIGQAHLESSDTRIAKCLVSDRGDPKFLLWDFADASDGMLPLKIRKFPEDDVRLLNIPLSFAIHQLLHEIAHHLKRDLHSKMNHDEIERDCDRWAFEQLKRPNQSPEPMPLTRHG